MEKHTKDRAHDLFAPSIRVKHLAGDWTRPVGELKEDEEEEKE